MAKESGIALLLGGNKKESSKDNLMDFDPESDDNEIESEDAFEDAASSVLQAIQENDLEAFADHLKDAIEICMMKSEGGEY